MKPFSEPQTLDGLTKDERSILCYAETCAVDNGGLMEARRMNTDDLLTLKRFVKAGLIHHARIKAALLGKGPSIHYTHWVELTDAGWKLAAECRRLRGDQRGPYARAVFEARTEVAG